MIDIEAQLRDTLRERAERVPVERNVMAIIQHADADVGSSKGMRHRERDTAAGPGIVSAEVRPVLGDPLVNGRVVERSRSREIGGGDRGRRPAILVGSAAAIALLVAGLVVVGRQDTGPDVGRASAPAGAPPTAPAPTLELEYSLDGLGWPPHILIGDGWEMVSADQRSINEGMVSFERDGQIAYVGWNRADQSEPDKGLEQAVELGAATLLGEPVTMLQSSTLMYAESDIRDLVASGDLPAEGVLAGFAPDATAAPPASEALNGATTTTTTLAADGPAPAALVGGPLLDEALADAVAAGQIQPVRADGPVAILQWDGTGLSVSVTPKKADGTYYDAAQFSDLLAAVGYTDEATWLAELPDRVVTPATRQQVVDELLAGVPLPDNVATDVFAASNNLVQDRINVAGELQQRVACSWLNEYFQSGDPARRSDAAEAIATMPDWPVSRELDRVDVPAGVIPSGNRMASLTLGDDDTLVYDATGEELDGYFAAQLCDFNAVG